MVFSASNVTAYMSHDVSPYNYFIKQGLFLIGGFGISIVILFFNSRSYKILSTLLMVTIIISLIVLLIIGEAQNQAVSWFDFGVISFQPSEFIKIIMIVWMSTYYERNIKHLNKYTNSLIPLGIGGLIAFLIFIQPDLGTTIIFSAIVGIMFLMAPIMPAIKNKTILGLLGAIVFTVLILFSTGQELLLERQMERFNITDPCSRLLTTGSQVCNGYIAINNGGLFGTGLGNSTQKYLYLPEPYTDFIYAIIVEELGIIIGILIIILYIILLYRIFKIGKNSITDRGALICYGIAFYIILHVVINLGGLFGIMPMTGVPLPFMSYGGSFTLCLMAAIAIVQRISIENRITKSKKK